MKPLLRLEARTYCFYCRGPLIMRSIASPRAVETKFELFSCDHYFRRASVQHRVRRGASSCGRCLNTPFHLPRFESGVPEDPAHEVVIFGLDRAGVDRFRQPLVGLISSSWGSRARTNSAGVSLSRSESSSRSWPVGRCARRTTRVLAGVVGRLQLRGLVVDAPPRMGQARRQPGASSPR